MSYGGFFRITNSKESITAEKTKKVFEPENRMQVSETENIDHYRITLKNNRIYEENHRMCP